MNKLKKRIFEILEGTIPNDKPAHIFSIFIVTLISLNVFAVIFETVPAIHGSKYIILFHYFEVFSVIIFSIEYILRLWSCTVSEKYSNPVTGRIKYAVGFMPLVDLAAILPFYLPFFIVLDLRFIRAVRLFRLFRLFKLGRYSESLKILINVLKAKKEELYITVFVVFILLVLASSIMYYAEHLEQPDKFSSIPAAMWWGVATLTTVGYGDIFPVTLLGKLLSAVIAVLSIGIFALPTGIIGSGFIEEMSKQKKEIKKCPHCGKPLE